MVTNVSEEPAASMLDLFYPDDGATGWTVRGLFPAVQAFSLFHSVQIGSGAHPAYYPIGTGGNFPGGEAAGS
jgi:hypothetical protein